jgi:septal ring factor EnvC (AmiA/AmiB activator)
MWDVALVIWKEYGIVGLIAACLGALVVYDRKRTNKTKKKTDHRITTLETKVKDIGEKVETVHDSCHIPEESVKKLFQEVEELKVQDKAIDGDLRELKAKVESLKDGQENMQTGITSILNHLLNTKE